MPPKPGKTPAKAAPQPAMPAKGKDAKKGNQAAVATTKPLESKISGSSAYLQIDPSLMQRTGLNSVQLQELIEIFSLVDVDHGGTISTDELGVLMNTLGLHPSQMELEAMVKELDSECTGEIDFESFVMAMTKKLETEITPEELAKAFKTFCIYDINNELVLPDQVGTMPRTTLLNILTSFGDTDKRMTTREAEDIIHSVASHGSHTTFDYTQFIQMYLPNASTLQKIE